MVARLKHVGTADWDRDLLNRSVNSSQQSAHSLMTRVGMPFGRGLTRLNVLLPLAAISCLLLVNTGVSVDEEKAGDHSVMLIEFK